MARTEQRKKLRGGVTGKGWLPGQSGNPGGRPKKLPITEALQEFFSDPANVKAYINAAAKHARNGSGTHFKEINDRVEGSVAQKHLHGGEDGGPIELEIRIVKTDARKNKGAD